MKLTVKELQRAISAIDEEIDFYKNKANTTGRFDTKEQSIKETESNVSSLFEVVSKLMITMYAMRKLVKQFNAENIDNKAAEIARLEAENGFIESLPATNQPRAMQSYGTDKTEYTSGCSIEYEKELRNKVKSNKRKIQSLKDSCSGINSNNKIEVPEDISSVLKEYNLVD